MDYRLHSLYRPLQINGMTTGSGYAECHPSASLLPYVACYWESGTHEQGMNELDQFPEWTHRSPQMRSAPGEVHQRNQQEGLAVFARVLPDGCSDILLTYDPVREELDMSYCGNYTKPFAFHEEPATEVDTRSRGAGYTFGVRFFPGGARVFHGISLDEFTDQRIPLEQCWPRSATELRELGERMLETTSFRERARLMDTYLNSWISSTLLHGHMAEGDLMKNVLHRIFTSRGQTSIQELAALETVSERQLHRYCKPWIGISPKRFSEVVRCQQVLASIQQGHIQDWAELAVAHGFFDQAHLIRHFRAWYGATPGVAAAEHKQKLSVMYNTSRTYSGTLQI
ncbi:helix-turn-helix domain-containing protein [Paenibacillus massiliensis]|uniref:AraC family transcriptional regulator n=1 Tax=Paenibacillus massiliensis TaxID=225917 RepID=UPI0004729859|nr:helix-turn-helix domain-containing protein [Paenibacillus massiliensis]